MSDFPYLVADELRTEFAGRGFVVTPDVFDAAELRHYATVIDAEVKRRTTDDHRTLAEKDLYEQSFVQCMRLWETNPEVVPFTCHHGLAGIATQLLQVNGVRLWQDQALYKEAGGRETTPHQDQTFWPIGLEPLVSAWIPLQDVTLDSGAMAYVPGSHLAGRLKVVDITHASEPYAILDDPALGGIPPEPVAVQAGSVIWHHGLTVHQAAANRSAQTRRVFTVVYIGDQARRIKAWPAYPLDRAGVQVGEIMRGAGLPRVWPPGEQWPEPPNQTSVLVGPQNQVE
ncbi:MAG: phytanoyl-CoA dioxygenase family protein [Pseudomonadota bacterium]